MLTPDYQEFPNRGRLATRDNTVIFRAGASVEIRKSAKRCAITTSPDGRQSGTLPPGEPPAGPLPATFTAKRGPVRQIGYERPLSPTTGPSMAPDLPVACR